MSEEYRPCDVFKPKPGYQKDFCTSCNFIQHLHGRGVYEQYLSAVATAEFMLCMGCSLIQRLEADGYCELCSTKKKLEKATLALKVIAQNSYSHAEDCDRDPLCEEVDLCGDAECEEEDFEGNKCSGKVHHCTYHGHCYEDCPECSCSAGLPDIATKALEDMGCLKKGG